jgi:hypothetical protein
MKTRAQFLKFHSSTAMAGMLDLILGNIGSDLAENRKRLCVHRNPITREWIIAKLG